ncbi:MAG: mechanosensitive ion channel [Candidatus Methylarchaceae archaeon HK01B]|nr:mechanosensitive ion channel [Candidatus Methylarchaceae archaeon HK01M]MCP8312645.1 mechanosensitive ion channel [Candidatus Methylarchaceae archaeon HK02M1]MCP8318294.1 mechanosensitive ion channel [Candidatus Methylarchaceae archaeon HK01B]
MNAPFDLFDIAVTVGILLCSFVIAIALTFFIKRYVARVADKTGTKIDDYAIMISKGPMMIFIILFGIITALGYWEARYPATLPNWISLNIDVLISIMSVLIAISVISLILNNYLGRRIEKILCENPERETTFRLIHRFIMYAIYLFGAVTILSLIFPGLVGALWGLVVGAGFLAIVIGLAARSVIGNFLSGININITQPVRIGDAIMVRGEYGFIEEITLRHTIIRTWDNRRMVIPNSVLDNEVIINYTLKDPKKLFGITVGVPYDTDLEKVSAIMIEEAKNHPNVLPELEPIFSVLNFDEGAITLRLLFMGADQGTAFGTACDLRRSIKKRFDKEGIKISCPARYIIGTERSIEKR